MCLYLFSVSIRVLEMLVKSKLEEERKIKAGMMARVARFDPIF